LLIWRLQGGVLLIPGDFSCAFVTLALVFAFLCSPTSSGSAEGGIFLLIRRMSC